MTNETEDEKQPWSPVVPPESEGGPAEAEATPPDPAADVDLVRLMMAEREVRRFYLPGPNGQASETYYVEARSWTGVERDRYNAYGSSLSMPFEGEVGGRRGQVPRMTRMDVHTDPVERFRLLLSQTVIGYHLCPQGRDVDRPQVGEFERRDWAVFAALPPRVKDWLADKLGEFLGIETVNLGEEEGRPPEESESDS